MISVIIPTLNEEITIASLVQYLQHSSSAKYIGEIIVADGGSSDRTITVASNLNVNVIKCNKRGRAAQMNEGAAIARHDVLYFLHADTYPPLNFALQILTAINDGFVSGCYRLQFDLAHWFLKANCWFTRFDVNAFRFGDQSLFVQRYIFENIGGFDEKLVVFEDQEIIARIRKKGRFIIIPAAVTTSARKYLDNGIYRTQGIYFVLYFMYKLGYSQQQMVNLYKRLIMQDKL